jgi:hypothetical protein
MSYKSQLSYDEVILLMQVTYRSYKRTSNFRGSSSLKLTQSMLTCNESHIQLNGFIFYCSSQPYSPMKKGLALGAFQAHLNVYMHTWLF